MKKKTPRSSSLWYITQQYTVFYFFHIYADKIEPIRMFIHIDLNTCFFTHSTRTSALKGMRENIRTLDGT